MGKTTAEAQATPPAPDPRDGVVRTPATTFTDAQEVEEIAYTVIRRWHPHLAASEIRYLFRDGGAWNSGGKTVLAKAGKLGAQAQFLAGDADAVIIVDAARWEELNSDQRLALVDHELCHLVQATDKNEAQVFQVDGRPLLRVRAHDVEEFVEVIQRHGLWDIDLVHAGKAIRQIPMELEEREEADDEDDAARGFGDGTRIEISTPGGPTATSTLGDLKRVADMAEHRGRRRRGEAQ